MFKKIISGFLIGSMILSATLTSFADSSQVEKAVTVPTVKEKSIGTMSMGVTPEEIFGSSWRMISPVRSQSYTYPSLSQWQSASVEGIRDIVLLKIGEAYKGYVGISFLTIMIAERFTDKIDYKQYGGVYTKMYYLAKPVSADLQAAKVPVACDRKIVIIVYKTKYMRPDDIVFQQTYDDIPSSVAWYKLSKPTL